LTGQADDREALKQENLLLQQQLEELKRSATSQPPGTEERLNAVMAELALLRSEADILQLEKSALEMRVQDLREASAEPAAALQQELAASRERIGELERERSQLQLQLAQANKDLSELSTASVGEPDGRVLAEVERLEARLAVYEAESIPYSAEELVLFRMSQEKESSEVSTPLPPAGAGTLVAKAESQFERGDFEGAEATLWEVLEEDDANAYALANLGATQLGQGKSAEAEESLLKALESEPQDPFALMTMGMLKFQEEEYDEALDYLGQAAQYNPDSPVIHNYLGVTLNEKGMRGPAETALRRAVQLQPEYGEAHFNLALVYALQDPPLRELARWHYQKALGSGHPRSTEVEQLLDRTTVN
jgi:tetratricopeptide (TPR) repeat protein